MRLNGHWWTASEVDDFILETIWEGKISHSVWKSLKKIWNGIYSKSLKGMSDN